MKIFAELLELAVLNAPADLSTRGRRDPYAVRCRDRRQPDAPEYVRIRRLQERAEEGLCARRDLAQVTERPGRTADRREQRGKPEH